MADTTAAADREAYMNGLGFDANDPSHVHQIGKPNPARVEPYAPGADSLDLSGDGGVLKEIKQIGCGTSKPGSQNRVVVHYLGFFPDGVVFDTSKDRKEKFEFTLGRGDVIKAWDLGVSSMLRGEVAIFYCKPEYAYGDEGHPPKIPPNSTLVFEIELFDWKGDDLTNCKDGGIIRHQLVAGTGYSSPKEGAMVEVHLIGRYNDHVFEDRELSFTLGEGLEHGVVDGVEKGLEKLLKGETSTLVLRPRYAFGAEGRPQYDIPPDATVSYEITLRNFENTKESWEMDTAEKIQQANICKSKGTDLFKEGKYALALKQYRRINEFLKHENEPTTTASTTEDTDDATDNECRQLILAAHLNMAMSHLKLNEFVEAREACDRALDKDPFNEKGLFRRGQSYLATSDFDLAIKDFRAVLTIDPTNKAAANQITICNDKIRQHKQKEKLVYGNMFAKFAADDRKREERRLMGQPDVMENPGTWDGKRDTTDDLQRSELEEEIDSIQMI